MATRVGGGASVSMPASVAASGQRRREYGVSKYGHLDKAELLRLLGRRDAERQLGLVWERDEIEADRAINDDYVALTLDESLATLRLAERADKPVRVVALDSDELATEAGHVREWLAANHVAVLNVAGPRESKRPGIYQQTLDFLAMCDLI
jgi:hypothetical protein